MTLTLLTALAVFALRLALYYSGRPVEGTEFMLVHFLAVVTIVFFAGHRLLLGDRRSGFPDLLREGFRNAAVYALLMMLFLWLHYSQLEADLFTQKIDERVAMGVAEGQPEELIRERMERFFTPFNYATITFFALLITGAFQAFLIGLVHHKFLRRFRP
jgi:hypothetical protein